MAKTFGPILAIAGLVAVGIAVAPPTHAAAAACASWNLSNDFQTTPNQANPNPDSCATPSVWFFDKSTAAVHDPAQYAPLDTYGDDSGGATGVDGWTNAGNPPFVLKNTGSAAAPYATASFPPHSVNVHPGAGTSAADGFYVVVGWKSPVTGSVSVTGAVTDDDGNGGNGIAWSIDHYDGATNTTLTSGSYPDGGSQGFSAGSGGPAAVNNIVVKTGDFLYFVIDPQGDYSFDSTELDVTVAPSPAANVPETPSGGLAVLGAGLVTVALWGRRSGRLRARLTTPR